MILQTAHELKTPVTTLKLLVQSHLNKHRNFLSHQTSCDDLSTVSRELDRLARLIDDLLIDGHTGSGSLEVRHKTLEMGGFIKEVVDEMRVSYKDRNIIFKKPLERVFTFVDPDRIKQVLINLISNAAKHSILGGKIIISLMQLKDDVVVLVKDKGRGIPKSKQRYIFNKFYQVQKKSKSEGNGLGLYIAKQIIKKHSGKIWFKSQEGKGSIFCFSLPALEASLE